MSIQRSVLLVIELKFVFFGVLAEGIKLTLIFPSLKYKQVQYFHILPLASRLSAKDTLIEKYD